MCAFGARGPARYFGGETALAGQIIAAVAELGVESRAGDRRRAVRRPPRRPTTPARPATPATPTTSAPPPPPPQPRRPAARYRPRGPAARRDPGRYRRGGRRIPGRGSRWRPGGAGCFDQDLVGQDLTRLLTRLGLRTLGDLAALPAGDVASRFGAAGEAAHRLARGLGSRPLAVRPPAAEACP